MNIRKLNEELEKLLERDFFDKLLYSKKDMETDIRNFLKNNVNEIGCCDYELGIDQNDYQLILTCQPYEDTFRVVLINADLNKPCMDENGYIVDKVVEQRDIDNGFRVLARDIVRRIEGLV